MYKIFANKYLYNAIYEDIGSACIVVLSFIPLHSLNNLVIFSFVSNHELVIFLELLG